jgi:hypothetical protein
VVIVGAQPHLVGRRAEDGVGVGRVVAVHVTVDAERDGEPLPERVQGLGDPRHEGDERLAVLAAQLVIVQVDPGVAATADQVGDGPHEAGGRRVVMKHAGGERQRVAIVVHAAREARQERQAGGPQGVQRRRDGRGVLAGTATDDVTPRPDAVEGR